MYRTQIITSILAATTILQAAKLETLLNIVATISRSVSSFSHYNLEVSLQKGVVK